MIGRLQIIKIIFCGFLLVGFFREYRAENSQKFSPIFAAVFGAEKYPPAMKQTFVANVGKGQITLGAVMEAWFPVWDETIAKAGAGKISASEVDVRLQQEWDKALDNTIRDELFYQEAMNDFDRVFQKNVDMMYQQMRANGQAATKQEAERRMKALLDKSRDHQISEFVNHNVQAAGGIDNLARVLIARGLTFDEWKNRVVRRAYTFSYLFSLFEPLGKTVQLSPKQIRAYYDSHPTEFSEPGDVIFQQIFLDNAKRGGEEKAYELAEDIYNEISDGKISFGDAVKKYSDDQEGVKRDGVEKSISPDPEREAWLADVRSAAADQNPNELGPVLVSPRGCHLTMLIRADPVKSIPFSRAQKTISEKMEQDKWEKKSRELYDRLRTGAIVQILMPKFPDEYRWENARRMRVPRQIGVR